MKERHPITAGNVALRGGETFFLIAGPCVIESEEHVLKMARFVQDVARRALRAGRRDG
jgi:3-deoxy-D-arabino-heptulosonate 7-phosphate (DAHP) synthase